jgi:hypothetical protein
LEELITVLALPLADGPAEYFGSTIMTFALPFGAFIATTVALFYLFRARHSGPRLRWSAGSSAQVTSLITREPGPAPAPGVTTAMSALPVPTEQSLAEQPSAASASEAPAPADTEADDETEGKDGEQG